MEVGDLRAKLTADSSEFVRGVKTAQDAASAATGGFTRLEAKLVSLDSTLNLLHAAFSTIVNVFETVANAVAGVIGPATESENAITKLNAALRSTGQDSAGYSAELQALASGLQSVTTHSDEEILSAERLLVSFGASRGKMEELTRAALDLSAGIGIDLDSASQMLGKAMQGNFAALQRFGIAADEASKKADSLKVSLDGISQKFGGEVASDAEKYATAVLDVSRGYGKAIESGESLNQMLATLSTKYNSAAAAAIEKYAKENLSAANSAAAFQSNASKLDTVLGQIKDKFGGQAGAEGSTFAGLLRRAAHAFEEVKEAIGKVIIESPALPAILKAVADSFNKLATFVTENKDHLIRFVNEGVSLAVTGVATLIDKAEKLATSLHLEQVLPSINAVKEAIDAMGGAVTVASQHTVEEMRKIDGVWVNIKTVIDENPVDPKLNTDPIFEKLSGFSDQLSTFMANLGLQVGAKLGSAIVSAALKALGDFFSTIPSMLGGLGKDLPPLVGETPPIRPGPPDQAFIPQGPGMPSFDQQLGIFGPVDFSKETKAVLDQAQALIDANPIEGPKFIPQAEGFSPLKEALTVKIPSMAEAIGNLRFGGPTFDFQFSGAGMSRVFAEASDSFTQAMTSAIATINTGFGNTSQEITGQILEAQKQMAALAKFTGVEALPNAPGAFNSSWIGVTRSTGNLGFGMESNPRSEAALEAIRDLENRIDQMNNVLRDALYRQQLGLDKIAENTAANVNATEGVAGAISGSRSTGSSDRLNRDVRRSTGARLF